MKNTRMNLDSDDCELFFKLHKALMLFVNERLTVVKAPTKSAKVIVALPPEQRLKVRDRLVEHLDLIDEFVPRNPFKFNPDELGIVRSWKDLVAGEFYVLRVLKQHTVFLTAKEPTVAYGVVGLSEPFEEVIDQPLPFLCKTVLLPFRDRIVYDGIVRGYNLIMGSNIQRELNDAYSTAKKRQGIVTSLPPFAEAPHAVAKRGTASKKRGNAGKGLIGRWRIIWMETWKQNYVDEEVEGFFKFNPDETGKFQFYCVKGEIDYREVERDGKPAVEFSWDGLDGAVPASGRGWAVIDGDKIEGEVFMHFGLDSAFRAVRKGR